MTLGPRDRRALVILGAAAAGTLLFILVSDSPPARPASGVVASNSIADAEKRLAKVRAILAQVPAREETLKQISAQLAEREKRILQADTAAQAQAQLLQMVRNVARSQNPPIDLKSSEFGQVHALEDYGEAPVTVVMECAIEQLLNLVTEMTAQPVLIAVDEMRVYSANAKNKTTNVRLTVTAVVPKKLVPEKKGVSY